MRNTTLGIGALAGLALFALSGPASAVSCSANGTTVSVDGTDLCAGPIGGNVPPYNLNDPSDTPDMGLGFADWDSIEKDDIGQGGEDNGLLQIMLTSNSVGQWRYTGTDGFTQLLLLVKFGPDFATFRVSGAPNTWYDWSIVPAQGNGLSHMELFGRAPGDDDDQDVPEPGTLALLGLGLVGLGLGRRRRA
jgi:hypothetical protein